MGRAPESALLILAICLLVVHTPAEAWYKQAARPSYYSVGRASGLLSGIRRSAMRREANTHHSGELTGNNAIIPRANSRNFALKNVAVCVKDIVPELRSCELMRGSMFRCMAAVIITLDSSNCVNAPQSLVFSD